MNPRTLKALMLLNGFAADFKAGIVSDRVVKDMLYDIVDAFDLDADEREYILNKLLLSWNLGEFADVE